MPQHDTAAAGDCGAEREIKQLTSAEPKGSQEVRNRSVCRPKGKCRRIRRAPAAKSRERFRTRDARVIDLLAGGCRQAEKGIGQSTPRIVRELADELVGLDASVLERRERVRVGHVVDRVQELEDGEPSAGRAVHHETVPDDQRGDAQRDGSSRSVVDRVPRADTVQALQLQADEARLVTVAIKPFAAIRTTGRRRDRGCTRTHGCCWLAWSPWRARSRRWWRRRWLAQSRLEQERALLAGRGDDLQPLLGARERDVGDASLGLHPLAATDGLVFDVQRAPMRELLRIAAEQQHDGPFASLRAVDGRKLDAVSVVADVGERRAAACQLRGELPDRASPGLSLEVVEGLDLYLLGATERALLLAQVTVQPAGAQLSNHGDGVVALSLDPRDDADQLAHAIAIALGRGETLDRGAPARAVAQALCDAFRRLEHQAARRVAHDLLDVGRLGLSRLGEQPHPRADHPARAVLSENRLRRADPDTDLGAVLGNGAQQSRRARQDDDRPAYLTAQSLRGPSSAGVGLRVLADPNVALGAVAIGRSADRLREAARVDGDQLGGPGHHLRRAAIVGLQRDSLQRGERLIERDDALDRRPPPRVQRLVLVADRQQRVLWRGHDPHHQFLRRLDVLKLVDQHAREAPLPARTSTWVLAQHAHGQKHEIIEVPPPPLGETSLIESVKRGQRTLLIRPISVSNAGSA